jgi:RNA polymerase sigma-70 factor (ECF subfamily)
MPALSATAGRPAFQDLLNTHGPRLRAFIGTLVRDPHIREDVFQNVSVALWRSFDRYDPERPFGPWALGVAARQVLKSQREDRRFPCIFPPETIALIQEQFERTDGGAGERHAALQDCVGRLPQSSRDLLAMRYSQELPCPEIAKRLSVSLDAVHQQLSRLRARLSECVTRRLNSDSPLP